MIYLRKAHEEDLPTITDLANRIWPTTYSEYLSAEQITYMLGKMYSRGELLHQLSQGHEFLIADALNEPVGFAGYSLIDPENFIYKLHKIYVLQKMQGQGVGRILLDEVITIAKKHDAKTLQLNVNRNNKALNFYESAGFSIKETVDLDIGNGFFMNDYVMEKEL
jgi:ribosomal protein S18 acetylase RimI-like enzyme